MDIGTIAGVVLAAVLIVASVYIGGGTLGGLYDTQSVLIVLGGTTFACVASFPLAKVLKLHKIVFKAMFHKKIDVIETVRELVRYAEVARREGILALENLTSEMNDEFIVRGVKMAVDGTDPELIKVVMDTELEALMDRHAMGKKIMDAVGKYAPAFGMIGTLMGLVAMLKNMQDPSAIGPGMAVALITTLYGALIANIVVGPIADKLAVRDAEEVLHKTMIITGVMAIQSGDNPRVVESKLLTYLPPEERATFEKEAA